MSSWIAARSPQPAARSPQPAARSPQPAARSPQPAARSPQPAARSPQPAARSPQPAARSPQPAARSPQPAARSPQPAARSPQPAARNFEHQTIWTRDNLEVLRGLNSGSVDLIYLDPPFNSGRQWSAPIGSEAAGASFKDAWTLSDVDLAWHGEIAERHPALYAILDAAGEAHGKPMKSYLIYMGVRLMEMRRVLAPTGSIYLHCDDTAGAYLKMTMDAVFGADNYRNEITWKRSTVKGSRGARKTLGKDVDSLLFYSRTGKTAFRVPKAKPANMPKFPHTDGVGNYRPVTRLIAEAGLHDCPKYEWRGLNPEYGWRVSKPNLEALYAEGRIHWNSKGKPFRKQYDFEYEGVDVGSLWADIPFLAPQAKERIGYPTQKPLALLERIVAASSNEGDMVLDPFCGCATACVAAEKLGREWAGIDISPKAAELVRSRLRGELGLFYRGPRAPTSATSRPTTPTSTSARCTASRKASATAAACCSPTATSRSTTSSRSPGAAATNSATSSCSARPATPRRAAARTRR